MENQNQQPIILSETAQQDLLETTKWAKYYISLTIISLSITFLFAFVPYSHKLNDFYIDFFHRDFPDQSIIAKVISVFFNAIILIFPFYALMQFSNFIKKGYESKEVINFELAFLNLKQIFKYIGILIIICISCFILLIIGAIIVALAIKRG